MQWWKPVVCYWNRPLFSQQSNNCRTKSIDKCVNQIHFTFSVGRHIACVEKLLECSLQFLHYAKCLCCTQSYTAYTTSPIFNVQNEVCCTECNTLLITPYKPNVIVSTAGIPVPWHWQNMCSDESFSYQKGNFLVVIITKVLLRGWAFLSFLMWVVLYSVVAPVNVIANIPSIVVWWRASNTRWVVVVT